MGNFWFTRPPSRPVDEGMVLVHNEPARIAELAETNNRGIQLLGVAYELVELSAPMDPTALEKLWLVLTVLELQKKDYSDEDARSRRKAASELAAKFHCKLQTLHKWVHRHKNGFHFSVKAGGRATKAAIAVQDQVAMMVRDEMQAMTFKLYSVSTNLRIIKYDQTRQS
jgi:transposase-like protein